MRIDRQSIHGFGGFHSDAELAFGKVAFRKDFCGLRAIKKTEPEVAAALISKLLRQHRFGSY